MFRCLPVAWYWLANVVLALILSFEISFVGFATLGVLLKFNFVGSVVDPQV